MFMSAPLLDQPAPDFTLSDLNGNIHHLADYRGDVVILNFWSAECPWSERTDRELIPALTRWSTVSGNDNVSRVILLSIAPNANEPSQTLAAAAGERGIPLVLLDADHQITEIYGAQTTPHLFVIDSAGILRYQGAFDDVTFRQRTPTRHYLKDAVDALLRGDAPDPSESPAYGCSIVFFPD